MKNNDSKVDFRISTGYFLEALRRIVVGLLAIVGLTDIVWVGSACKSYK